MSKSIKFTSFRAGANECVAAATSSIDRAIAMRPHVPQWDAATGFPAFGKLEKALAADWKAVCAGHFDARKGGTALAEKAGINAAAIVAYGLRDVKRDQPEAVADAIQALATAFNQFASNAWRDQIVMPDNRAESRARAGKAGAEITDWREKLAKSPIGKGADVLAQLLGEGFEIPGEVQKAVTAAAALVTRK